MKVIDYIVKWLLETVRSSRCEGFVVGISGGIDSALTSALAAKTGMPVIVLNMPINQEVGQYNRSNEQAKWLKKNFDNVESKVIDLSAVFNSFVVATPDGVSPLAYANSASRIRMTTLYLVANDKNYLVVGTGNRVEDYGIGFFTKYGDGGIDISPIADLLKSEVYALAKFLGVPQSIQEAVPTDGLWDDNRSDEDQIGATYEELEWALKYYDEVGHNRSKLTPRQSEVLSIYEKRHLGTQHKLRLPPTCLIPENLKH